MISPNWSMVHFIFFYIWSFSAVMLLLGDRLTGNGLIFDIFVGGIRLLKVSVSDEKCAVKSSLLLN